jgi:hypothetical protein
LLNRPAPETSPDIPPAEIRKAVATLNNGKAARPDNISAEAITADTDTAVTISKI